MQPRNARGATDPLVVVLILLVAGLVTAGYFLYTLPAPAATGADSQVAASGDKVSIDYIGTFGDGLVFDTSLRAVAFDNATYPKAISFTARLSSDYRPLDFTIGASPRQVIEGFENGVLGMRVGERKTVAVPPEQGYGERDPTQVQTKPLVEELALREVTTRQNFSSAFQVSDTNALENGTFRHPFWHWNVTVLDVDGERVTFEHNVVVGTVGRVYEAWDAEVTFVDAGAGTNGLFRVEHQLTQADANAIAGEGAEGEFRVVAVDTAAGTYTLDFNRQVVGVTLIFDITLVKLTKGR